MSLFKKIFSLYNTWILAILYPTSLVNLVVEVGTRHSHQILLERARTTFIGNRNTNYNHISQDVVLLPTSHRKQWLQLLIKDGTIDSFAHGRFQFNFRKVIFKLTLVNDGWGISYEIALRWMPQDVTDDKSTLVQVMAWCPKAPSHYLSQCWPRSMSANGITRPQWVFSSMKTFSICETLFTNIGQ